MVMMNRNVRLPPPSRRTARTLWNASRRDFLKQGAGVGMALNVPLLLSACGGGDAADDAPPLVHERTLFFNLAHEDFVGKTYYLTGGGRRYALARVSDRPETLQEARQTNAFLRAVPTSQLTHVVEGATFASDSVTLCYVSAEIDVQAGTWSMSAVQLYIPPAAAAHAYAQARMSTPAGALPLSSKRRFYGAAPAMTEQDLRDERVLLDPMSHASALVGCHPDLMSLEPISSHILNSNHIDRNIDVFNLGQRLAQAGPATPQLSSGQPNAGGWATLQPVPGDSPGAPLRNQYGQHKGRIQYQPSLQPSLRPLAATGITGTIPGVQNDTSLGADVSGLSPTLDDGPNNDLSGALWLRHDGLTRIDQSAGMPAASAGDFSMVLKQQNPQSGFSVKAGTSQSAGVVKVSLTCLNWFLEFRGVWLQFLDANNNVMNLTAIPEYVQGTIVPAHDKTSDTVDTMFVTLIGPVFTVLGIPTWPGFVQPSFNLPARASTVRILCSGLSFQGGNNYRDTVVQGAMMTGVFNYGVTSLLAAAGAGLLTSALWKTIVIPFGRPLALELVALLNNAINPNGDKPLVDELLTPGFWETQGLIVAKIFVTKGTGVAVKALVDYIIPAITEGVAEDAVPLAGQIMQAVSIAVGAASLIETSVALACTPWTYINDLVFTHDLSVTILKDSGNPNADPPDPGDDTFPKAANTYTVTAMFDDGTPYHKTFALTTPVPSTLPPVVFSNVPLGGQVNVSVAFAQKASSPGQLDVLLGKGTTGLIANVTGPAPTFAIEELAFPISANTVYEHRQKTTLDANGKHQWAAGAAPTANAGNSTCGAAGTLCGFRSISVRQGTGAVRGYLGYAWQGQNSDPNIAPSCVAGGVGQLDQQANLNTDSGNAGANAQLGYVNGGCGIGVGGVKVAYSLLSNGGGNFYLDTSQPAAPMVRQVTLEPTPAFASPISGQAWGALNFSSDAMLLHPAGHLVSINNVLCKIETHQIPLAPMADAAAQVQLLAQVKSGKGSRPGLIDSPVAAAITPGGVILVLEVGNNRIQALDLGANPVRHFNKLTGPNASPYSLTLGGTDPMQGWQYLDLAVEFTGYMYVLSYNQNTFIYRLDLYHPDQTDGNPIATTQDINAARLTVDFWRNVYTLNYEVLQLPGGAAAGLTEPSVSLWTPALA